MKTGMGFLTKALTFVVDVLRTAASGGDQLPLRGELDARALTDRQSVQNQSLGL